MEWLNIHTSDLDSSEFVGEGPVARGTWLCLLRFCAGQENGGVIKDCAQWPDRRWQQIARVTKEEVMEKTALWVWDGDDLLVWGYPISSEAKIAAKRKAGAAGGRSKSEAKASAARENGAKQQNKQNPSETQANTQANTQAKPKQTPKVREGKEREGKEMEGNSCATNFVDAEGEDAPALPSRAGNGNTDGSAVAQATPSQEKGSDLLENEETGGNTLLSQFDGLHDTFPVLAKTSAFPAKETANAGHPADSSKAKRKKHERNALLDALVVLDGTALEFATGPAWSRAAAALKTIREVSPDVTASEIEAASRAYKRKFPDAICSSSALAKWWGSLQVPEPKSAYPSYSIGAPLTPEQKAEEEARANEMRQFLRANLTTT